jgi:hypothetical protein
MHIFRNRIFLAIANLFYGIVIQCKGCGWVVSMISMVSMVLNGRKDRGDRSLPNCRHVFLGGIPKSEIFEKPPLRKEFPDDKGSFLTDSSGGGFTFL